MNSIKTILIIEDHDDSRMLYGEILRMDHFEVIETEDGAEAINYLSQHPRPDLIIMDLNFPKMSAQEFRNKLLSHDEWKNIPVLIISGQWDLIDKAEELRVAGYIKKPFDMDPFIQTIRKLVGRQDDHIGLSFH